jgi:hypothetical protein
MQVNLTCVDKRCDICDALHARRGAPDPVRIQTPDGTVRSGRVKGMAQAARDFGASRKGRDGFHLKTPIVIACLVAAAIVAAVWSVRQQSIQIADATADTHAEEIVGPPCPPVVNAHFKQPLLPINAFDWDGVRFGRRFGEAECSAVARKNLLGNGYEHLCQFSSPAVLSVVTAKGAFYFELSLGQEASVFVADGVARCVMASPYFKRWKEALTETDSSGKPTFAKSP